MDQVLRNHFINLAISKARNATRFGIEFSPSQVMDKTDYRNQDHFGQMSKTQAVDIRREILRKIAADEELREIVVAEIDNPLDDTLMENSDCYFIVLWD